MGAFKYTHDDEARVGSLVVRTDALDGFHGAGSGAYEVGGTVRIALSQDEAIELYEILRAHWAGYVAERDEAKRTATDWKFRESMLEARAEERAQWEGARADEDFSDFGYPLDPDLARDLERGK